MVLLDEQITDCNALGHVLHDSKERRTNYILKSIDSWRNDIRVVPHIRRRRDVKNKDGGVIAKKYRTVLIGETAPWTAQNHSAAAGNPHT